MSNKIIVEEIEQMDEWQKLKIYFNYRSVQKALFYFTDLIEITEKNKHFFENIDYPFLGATESKYIKKDTTMTFDDFVSKENIKQIEYNQTGFQTVYTGIYDWFLKMKK